MSDHTGLNSYSHGRKKGINNWCRHLKMSLYGRAAVPETKAEAAAEDAAAKEDEPSGIPPKPAAMPLSDAEYDLMRQALINQHNAAFIRQGYAHSIDVAHWCARVAERRQLEVHTACLAGFLHDIYYYATGLRPLHAQNSAEQARVLLKAHSTLSEDEQSVICRMIFRHHSEEKLQDDMAKLLRDAHILSAYTGPKRCVLSRELSRLTGQLVPEWKLPEPQRAQVIDTPKPAYQGSRSALAEVAQTLASQRISWYAGEADALMIARYWPEANAFAELSGNWAAAFVYHCCYEAGFILPIRYQNAAERFCTIKSWLDFASMLCNGFFHPRGESGFTPERGDIVVFDRLLEDKEYADHMGIVVMTSPDRITVAEGNARASNVSDVIEHSATHHVRGYIRMPNDFRANVMFQ